MPKNLIRQILSLGSGRPPFLGSERLNATYTPRFPVLSPELTDRFSAEVLQWAARFNPPAEVLSALLTFLTIRFKPAMEAMHTFAQASSVGSAAAVAELNHARAVAAARTNQQGLATHLGYDEISPENIETIASSDTDHRSSRHLLTLAKAVCALPQAMMLIKLLGISLSSVLSLLVVAILAFLFSTIWQYTTISLARFLASTEHLDAQALRALRTDWWRGVVWLLVNLSLLFSLLALDAYFLFSANQFDRFGNPSSTPISWPIALLAAFVFSGGLFAATLAGHVLDENAQRRSKFHLRQLSKPLKDLRLAEANADAAVELGAEIQTQFHSTWLTLLGALRAIKLGAPPEEIIRMLLVIPTSDPCPKGKCD